MNNQKPQKPTLTGQRFKTRKRGLSPLIIIPSTALKPSGSSWIQPVIYFSFSPHQMKRRDLTLLSFKKVSYKAWTKLALIWTQLQSSWMPLAPSLTTADMQRHSLTSWWPVECWVSRRQLQQSRVEVKVNDACCACLSVCAAPGGTLSDDMTRTDYCLFTAQEDLETMQAYAQVYGTRSPNSLVLIILDFAKLSWYCF